MVQAANDKQQLQPMLNQMAALPDTLGRAETLLGDTGYFSAANGEAMTTWVAYRWSARRCG